MELKEVKFSEIDILSFGNNITMQGMVMDDKDGGVYLLMLPMEKVAGNVSIVRPSPDEWLELTKQLDSCYTRDDKGVIIRKGQRIIDQKIAWDVYRRDKYSCRYCGIDNVPLTVDHIITWESGGATHPDNLLSSCRKCNKTRGNLDYGSWLQHKYYIEKSKFLKPDIIAANEAIVAKLSTLPRNLYIKSR